MKASVVLVRPWAALGHAVLLLALHTGSTALAGTERTGGSSQVLGASSSTAGSALEKDTDRYGSDFRRIADVLDPESCQRACDAEASCRAWTWVKPGVQAPGGVCYLKNPAPSATKNTCCVSGLKGAKPKEPAPSSTLERDTDRYGSDFRRIADVVDPETCQRACGAEAACRAWAWVKPGVQAPGGVCYLKNPAPAATRNTCCVSGLKGALETGGGSLPAPEPIKSAAGSEGNSMTYVALKGFGIFDIAEGPDGRILAATHAGLRGPGQSGTFGEWTGQGLPRTMDKVAAGQVAVSSRGTVFIAIGSGGTAVGNEGVYRLPSGGSGWEQTGKGVFIHPNTQETVMSLAVLPDDTVFCTVSNTSLYRGQSRPAKLFRSTDDGVSWQEVSPVEQPAGLFLGPIVPGPLHQLWMVAGTTEAWDGTRDISTWILTTDDYRAPTPRWRATRIPYGYGPANGELGGYEVVVTRVAVDPRGSLFALVTGGRAPWIAGVYRSMNKGESWQRVTSDALATLYRLAMAVTPEGDIYVSSYGGIHCSRDGGTSWQNYAQVGAFVSDLLVDRQGFLWASTTSLGLTTDIPGLFRSRQPVSAAKGGKPAKGALSTGP